MPSSFVPIYKFGWLELPEGLEPAKRILSVKLIQKFEDKLVAMEWSCVPQQDVLLNEFKNLLASLPKQSTVYLNSQHLKTMKKPEMKVYPLLKINLSGIGHIPLRKESCLSMSLV